jgi:hypothetical protein
MGKISKRRYIILGIIYCIIFSLFIFSINVITNNFYNLVDNDGECIVSGYDIQVKTIKIDQQTLYECTPMLLVNFTYNEKPYSYKNTYSVEYPYYDDNIHYNSFDDYTKNDCINKLRTNGKYEIGKNIGYCYRSYYSDDNEFICRKQHTDKKTLHNGYCDKHYNKGDYGYGYVYPISLILSLTGLSCFFMMTSYAWIIDERKPKIISKIFKKKPLLVLPVTINDNHDGSFEVLYKVSTDKIEPIDDAILLESGEKKMK